MDYVNYLKNNQEIPYKIFYNALKTNKIFHAYLLVGEIGTPLLDIAKFLSASILCENPNPFACLECNNCHRVMTDNYGDLIILDTEKNQIKIDDIRNLESEFAKTSNETKGIKIYIINLIENLGVDSTNALLKFLEEPLPNTYAFFTTNSEFKLLPTIKSRVQTIHFSLLNQDTLIENATKLGVKEENAELLSFFYNDENLIKEKENDEVFKKDKELVLDTLNSVTNKSKLLKVLHNEVLKKVKDKITARSYFDYIIVFFKEALKFKYTDRSTLSNYVDLLNKISKLDNLEDLILELMNARNELNWNLNIPLLIIHTFSLIK